MDFFSRQDQARQNTRYLVLVFLLAVVGIVIAVNIVVAFVVANIGDYPAGIPTLSWTKQNWPVMLWATLGTVGLISTSSLYRTATLSLGGGHVARQFGGTQVTSDVRDPLRRRLHNVVEEIAIASGMPVPEVYVLEQEAGINAFAAGFTTGDAAIAVTRGCLERLDRNELQGVIAHEFSHILNGDMRLNMRLIGILFGILVIALIGRTIVRGSRFGGIRSRDGRGAGAIILAGFALVAIGYLGLFCGRLIRAAVSRQREFLADASAVQFTRQTEGLAGALKKIGGFDDGSVLRVVDSEEVGHMLFASGERLSSLLATHPPLVARIRALDPSFDPTQYPADTAEFAQAQPEETLSSAAIPPGALGLAGDRVILDPQTVTDAIGNPGAPEIRLATRLQRIIPPLLHEAIASPVGAVAVSLALILDDADSVRGAQLRLIAQRLGHRAARAADEFHATIEALGPRFRLPLLELSFPALKQRPLAQIDYLLDLIAAIIDVDGVVDPFEYALSRVLRTHLEDAETPAKRLGRIRGIRSCIADLQVVFSILAGHGHEREGDARDAYTRGMSRLLGDRAPPYSSPAHWATATDQALSKLDLLTPADKEKLIEALVVTIAHDERMTIAEAEMLRAICAVLHCPLPPFVFEESPAGPT